MVVIDVLIPATILTLIVLPTLYVMFENRWHKGLRGPHGEGKSVAVKPEH